MHAKFSEKHISYPLIRTCTYVCVSGCKKGSFFGKFGVLCFLVTTVLRFALLPYHRQIAIRYLCRMRPLGSSSSCAYEISLISINTFAKLDIYFYVFSVKNAPG